MARKSPIRRKNPKATKGLELIRETRLLTGEEHNHLSRLAWSLDGEMLASGTHLMSRRDESAEVLPRLEIPEGTRINGLSFCSDLVAGAANDGTIRIWNFSGGQPLHVPKATAGPATDVSWSPDGRSLASVSQDGTALVWEMSLSVTLSGRQMLV
jgi:WD40 repeat protein